MNRPRAASLVLVLALVFVLVLPRAHAVEAYEPPPMSWLENSWGATVTGDYFMSNTNYDQIRGSYTRLPGPNFSNTFTSHLRARYGLTRDINLFAGFGLAQTNVRDIFGDKSSTSITDIGGGLDFVFWRRWIKLIFEAQGGYPIDAVDVMQTKPLTSDGVPFGRIGIFAYRPFRYFRLTGFVGFDYPTVNLSKKVLYQVYGEIPISKVSFGGGINGYEAVIDDSLSQAERVAVTLLKNGGSTRFYAWNPGLLEARAWIGFKPNKQWSFRVGYAKTLNGLRTAEGQSVLFSIGFNARDLFGPSVETLEEDARSVETFVPDTEKTDQSLFRDEPPPKPARKGRIPRKTGPSAEESLDQTEKLLERKGER